jgi:hypothetical protein
MTHIVVEGWNHISRVSLEEGRPEWIKFLVHAKILWKMKKLNCFSSSERNVQFNRSSSV